MRHHPTTLWLWPVRLGCSKYCCHHLQVQCICIFSSQITACLFVPVYELARYRTSRASVPSIPSRITMPPSLTTAQKREIERVTAVTGADSKVAARVSVKLLFDIILQLLRIALAYIIRLKLLINPYSNSCSFSCTYKHSQLTSLFSSY